MYFLLRCVFWLGLVFLAMARDAGALPFALAWSAPATQPTMQRVCEAAPRLCAKVARDALAAAERGSTQSQTPRGTD